MLRLELRRAFFNINFPIALCIGSILLGIGLNDYAIGYSENQRAALSGNSAAFIYRASDALLWARGLLIVTAIVPLLAVLPFADSFTFDYHTRYLRTILPRSTRSHYIISKVVANSLAGGAVLVLAHLVIYAIASLMFPENTAIGTQPRLVIAGPLSEIYPQNPVLFTWVQIAISFVFGATYALLGVFISFLTESRFVVLATPFVLYIIATFILSMLGLSQWIPTATFNPLQVTTTSWITVFGGLGLLVSLSVIGIVIAAKRLLANC